MFNKTNKPFECLLCSGGGIVWSRIRPETVFIQSSHVQIVV